MNEEKPKKIVKIVDIIPSSRPAEPISYDDSKPEQISEENLEPEAALETETTEEFISSEDNVGTLEISESEERERIFPEGLFVSKPKKSKKRILAIFGIVCIIALAAICYFFLSKAEVIIKPKTEAMQFQAELSIDKNIAFLDLGSNKIPGQIFQVEKEDQKEFLTTQERDVREKAKGIITIYNQYSSAPQTLVASTRFVSEKEEKVFRTTKTVVVPGAKVEEGQIIPSTIDVEIEAAEPGKEYNIAPSSFTIPGFKGTAKYTGFYGKSQEAMAGGLIGKVKVVTAEDIKAAKDILTAELKGEAKKELEKKTPSNLKILKETTLEEIVESSSSVAADQPAERFTVKIKIAVKGLGFSQNDAVSLINDNLKEKISGDKSLLPDTVEINYAVSSINIEKGIARLTCNVKESVAWKIDIEKIRQDLAGKSEVDVRQYLTSRPEIESAKVVFWPFWVKKIPSNKSKIKITID